MKFVIGEPKTGKCYQIEIEKDKCKPFYGEKIGSKISGSLLGLTGYELIITGGSDQQGFPMRKDIHGTKRKTILLSTGVGFRKKRKGERRKKTICGNKVHENIAQINLKVIKIGDKALAKVLGKEETPKTEEEKPVTEKVEKTPEEKPKEEKKIDEPKKEKVEEKPVVEKKEKPTEEKKKETPKEENKPEPEKKVEEPKQEEEKESITKHTERVLEEIKEEKVEGKVEKEEKPEEVK